MDGVSARILKIAASAIAPSLAKLINICIARGTFPTAWKEAKVTPIHKQNSKSDKNNYRPISVLPVLSKIFKRHLHNSLSAFLKDNHLLYSLQSAFRRYHSTETALIEIVDRMLLNIDDNRINGLLLADFQKAFDLVNHDLLIEKLRIYGLDDNSLDLMRSFLQNRTQRAVIRGAQSSSKTLTHGEPKGSLLSPLLFLMHINDLPEAVSQPTTVDIFADDTTLSSCSPYMNTSRLCSKLCQSTLELEEWSRSNRFKLNTDKTKSMFVTGTRLRAKIDSLDQMEIRTSKGNILETTTSHKLLGVYIDSDLSFNEHVEHLCNKLAKRIGVLRSIKHFSLPFNERILFYNATIKPLFLYGGAVWSMTSKTNIRRVFRLQKRAARTIRTRCKN